MVIDGAIDGVNIIYHLAFLYVILLFLLSGIYLVGMYNQYKNAHDHWYGIERDYKKTDDDDDFLNGLD